MTLDLFKSYGASRGEMHFKHWQILLLSIAFSWIIWSIANLPIYSSLKGDALIIELIRDFAEQIVETTILLEMALLYIRLIVRIFWKKHRCLFNLLLQVLILTILNCASAALMGWIYMKLYPTHDHIFAKIVYTDSFNLTVLSSCYLMIFLVNRYRDESDALLVAEKRLKEEENIRLRAELNNLAVQTDNHFVFNNLSVLSELIATEPVKAGFL